MNSLYEPLDHKKRAIQMRKDADECHYAGFICIRDINWEMAEHLDPLPDPDDENNRPISLR